MLNFNFLSLLILVSATLPLISSHKNHKEKTSKEEGRVSRIFKGQYDTEHEYRYHVAILKVHPNETTEHICGGAILENNYILTAAHCVHDADKNSLTVRSGWNKDSSKPWLDKRVYHKISKIMYLKDYYFSPCRHHQNDIAILKVSRSFDLADDKNFKKVNLPEYDNDFEGYDVTFTGYGVEKIAVVMNKTSKNVRKVLKYPNDLKFMETKVLPLEFCKRESPIIVTNGNLCTRPQNPNGFSCVGDSGGPLVHDGVVVGIRNSHLNECIHDHPEIFTRVSTHLGFIHKVLNNEFSFDIEYV